MAHHHIPSDWLASYAVGAVDDATSALIAAHLTYCPDCRAELAKLEAIGGAMLDAIEPGANVDDVASPPERGGGARESELSMDQSTAPSTGNLTEIAPRPLAAFVHAVTRHTDFEALPWRPYAPGIKRAQLTDQKSGTIARFIRANPGSRFPHHDHGSDELTIVLKGAYRDMTGTYAVGDVQCIGETERHQPVIVGDEVCIGFVVSEKPPIPTGLIAKVVQRFIG